jgi:hypothetical protein
MSIEVTASGHLIVQSEPRGVLRAQLFDVAVTVDRDGDQEVWTREQWQELKEVVLDEWSTPGCYRELELPAAVDAHSGPPRTATGYSSSRCHCQKQFAPRASNLYPWVMIEESASVIRRSGSTHGVDGHRGSRMPSA